MGLKITTIDGEVVKLDRAPVLVDLDGNDALAQDGDTVKRSVKKFATAALPLLLVRALNIVQHSKGKDREIMEAMKFIRSLADMSVTARQVKGQMERLSDEELAEVLTDAGKDLQSD